MSDNEKSFDGKTGNELVIAADLGGTHLRVATVDANGRIHERLKQDTPPSKRAADIVEALAQCARELERRATVEGALIRALCVAVPGTVQFASGIVTKAPNLPLLDNFNLAAALKSELRYTIILENDANAAAVGEMWQGAGRGSATLVCITLGTGVGGGIILDGKLWRGVDGSAGELGHIAIDPQGVPCNCGSRGCLEVYGSATAIVRMAREASADFPDSTLNGVEDLTSEKVYNSALAGDAGALEVLRRMGWSLGVGLASLINIFNPEIIVIGGGVAAGWDLFIEHIRAEVASRAFPIPAQRAKIVRAEKGDDAGLLGAAHIAFTQPAP
jgi:glucokinase